MQDSCKENHCDTLQALDLLHGLESRYPRAQQQLRENKMRTLLDICGDDRRPLTGGNNVFSKHFAALGLLATNGKLEVMWRL